MIIETFDISAVLKPVKLLVESGADINVKDDSVRTPLSIAAEHGYLDLVMFLARHGADTNS